MRNPTTGDLEMPPPVNGDELTDDWDFRNFSDEWLPSWVAVEIKIGVTLESERIWKAK